jgi:hypothetical protein
MRNSLSRRQRWSRLRADAQVGGGRAELAGEHECVPDVPQVGEAAVAASASTG